MKQNKFKIGIILTESGEVINEIAYNPNIEKSPIKLKFYLTCDETKKKFFLIPYGNDNFTYGDILTLESLFEPKNVKQLSKLVAIIIVTYKIVTETELSKEEFLTYDFVISYKRNRK